MDIEDLKQRTLIVLKQRRDKPLQLAEIKQAISEQGYPGLDDDLLLVAIKELGDDGLVDAKLIRTGIDQTVRAAFNIGITARGRALTPDISKQVVQKNSSGAVGQEGTGYVTRRGECFAALFEDKKLDSNYDGVFYLFRLKDLAKGRGERLVQVFRSGHVKLFVKDYDSRIESVRINAIRRAFDNGTLDFDSSYEEDKYQRVNLTSNDFSPQTPATEVQIREFIKHTAYWVGYRHNPDHERYPTQFDLATDCDYLGVTAQDVRRNVGFLKGQGLIEKVFDGLGLATSQLLTDYEDHLQEESAKAEALKVKKTDSSTIPSDYQWDVFISHSHADKDIAQPLAKALELRGFRVWYDETTLTLGDSLRESIDRGLAQSRFGVVILSPSFFTRHWPKQELNGLATLERGGKKVILPVWHKVGHEEVSKESPTLADRYAVNTSAGLDKVAAEIIAAFKKS